MEILKKIWTYLKKLNIEVPKSWIESEAIRDMMHKAALKDKSNGKHKKAI